jgi:hypothetical protein
MYIKAVVRRQENSSFANFGIAMACGVCECAVCALAVDFFLML